ncbi:uncharacterized protein LOC128309635 [Anopheles moucheti]|uniref:uncharacterized protein LOC128309635 n=1 Tax=Anopheles moucheti TaxID=186751 RepID=UPI0022F064CC|nr:uncharacterized protein LOC128309635 [Anopheles moucheti]
MGRVGCYAIALIPLCLLLVVDLSLTQSCGTRKVVNFLIVNGTEAKDGYWPWHVAIFHNNARTFVYACGGTIVDQNTILTAAHCLMTSNEIIARERLVVQVGRNRLRVDSNRAQEHEAFQLIVHPQYNVNSIQHDIALIKLATDITYTDYIQPICLWNRSDDLRLIEGSWGTVIGFGVDETDEVSDTLREITIPIVSHFTCIESNRGLFGSQLTSNMFCAGKRDGISACNGDSGGGLFFKYNDVWFVRGVVSFTKPRQNTRLCDTNEYTVFTDVAKYLSWIGQHVRGIGDQPEKKRHVNELLNWPKIKKISAIHVNALIEGFERHTKLLEQLGEGPELWGVLLVQLLVSKLDDTTQREWERSVEEKGSTDYTTTRVLQQLAEDEGEALPFGKRALLENFYVDDYIGGADDENQALRLNIIPTLPMSTCGPNPYASRDEFSKPILQGYPWMGLLEATIPSQNEPHTFCQAILISDRYVITAGTCGLLILDNLLLMTNFHCRSFVRLGEYDRNNESDCAQVDGRMVCSPPVQILRIESVITHKELISFDKDNDIALIRLRDRADTSQSSVRPICLPVTNELRSQKSTHYLSTSWPCFFFKQQPLLQRSLLEFVKLSECQQEYEKVNISITTRHMCTKYSQESCEKRCRGTPLQLVQEVQGESRYVLYGILSLRYYDCPLNIPAVFTNVASYVDWILENIEE